jgi:hypothetical protein
MSKEILNKEMESVDARCPGTEILNPGDLPAEKAASEIIRLLNSVYVEHAITNNEEQLVEDISRGDVLTWFASKDQQILATASLIKQDESTWELGRAVATERGNGIGKKVILEALKFHLENQEGKALIAEVRAADNFEGVPSGQATQKIFFGTVNKIKQIRPFAVAPLFAHGKPLRSEQFILSASDVKGDETISERIRGAIEGRDLRGVIPRLHLESDAPFRLVRPNDNGSRPSDMIRESETSKVTTLFQIEATDRNLPLIGILGANPEMVFCGVDRILGDENKPVILVASLSFQGNDWHLPELATHWMKK